MCQQRENKHFQDNNATDLTTSKLQQLFYTTLTCNKFSLHSSHQIRPTATAVKTVKSTVNLEFIAIIIRSIVLTLSRCHELE